MNPDRARVQVEQRGGVAVLTMLNPPVNSLPQAMRHELWLALEEADANPAVLCIVITGAGRGFCAGGDFSEIRSPLQQAWPGISNHLLPRIEGCRKPVIAALHGFAVGGGLELALACHHRVAHRDTRLALPEINHGVIPPSGSQRLPRAVGVDRALHMIVSAQHERAADFAGTALLDTVCDGDVVAAALDFAIGLDAGAAPATRLLRHRYLPREEGETGVAAWRERLRKMPQATAVMHSCVDAVEFAVRSETFDAGLAHAKHLHGRLVASVIESEGAR